MLNLQCGQFKLHQCIHKDIWQLSSGSYHILEFMAWLLLFKQPRQHLHQSPQFGRKFLLAHVDQGAFPLSSWRICQCWWYSQHVRATTKINFTLTPRKMWSVIIVTKRITWSLNTGRSRTRNLMQRRGNWTTIKSASTIIASISSQFVCWIVDSRVTIRMAGECSPPPSSQISG